jgi:hypothetical protein
MRILSINCILKRINQSEKYLNANLQDCDSKTFYICNIIKKRI